jgi:hypothetical protein
MAIGCSFEAEVELVLIGGAEEEVEFKALLKSEPLFIESLYE